MKIYQTTIILLLFMAFSIMTTNNSYSGVNWFWFSQTDAGDIQGPRGAIVYFFDLRDRETFIQLTYPNIDAETGERNGSSATAHVQIYDVSNNCNENNFFDVYTPNDTHVYNMRDIQTNDGNPSGVVLPDGAYGIVTIFIDADTFIEERRQNSFGNMRIIDNNGYEYRTNAQTLNDSDPFQTNTDEFSEEFYSFNFNKESGITFSDVIGVTTLMFSDGDIVLFSTDSSDVATTFQPFDIDILDDNENVFSCRNVIFSCVDENNPRLKELLENAETASVASFEYGINNAIPHTKDGELLCPGNTIDKGFVKLRPLDIPQDVRDAIDNKPNNVGPPAAVFYGFIGLNNGNSRGSLDSFWFPNFELIPPG